jgi:hypothetical protein
MESEHSVRPSLLWWHSLVGRGKRGAFVCTVHTANFYLRAFQQARDAPKCAITREMHSEGKGLLQLRGSKWGRIVSVLIEDGHGKGYMNARSPSKGQEERENREKQASNGNLELAYPLTVGTDLEEEVAGIHYSRFPAFFAAGRVEWWLGSGILLLISVVAVVVAAVAVVVA